MSTKLRSCSKANILVLLQSINSPYSFPDRDGLKFCAHAEKLPGHAEYRRAHNVDEPPGQGVGQAAVVPNTRHQVEKVDGAGKVEAQLCPLDNVPQSN